MTKNTRKVVMNDSRPINHTPQEIWLQPWCDACENDSCVDGGREMDTINVWPNGCTRAAAGECASKAAKYVLDSPYEGENNV